jgi:hypothetical protein
MKTKIASLEVYLTDSQDIPSHLKRTGPQSFELAVNPLIDERVIDVLKRDGKITANTTDLMQNIIAHELGHFVAFMTKCPTHSMTNATKRPITVNGEQAYQVLNPQAEMRAWTLAGHMLGDKLSTALRDLSTATYTQGKPVVI